MTTIEELLALEEEYELKKDEKIAFIILQRAKRFSKGESRGYTQDEVEKIFGESYYGEFPILNRNMGCRLASLLAIFMKSPFYWRREVFLQSSVGL
jgi:hypothetical protein